MNVVIIEDEKPARDLLCDLLQQASQAIHIQAKLQSVKESREYFRKVSLMPDIIFSDVQLCDGLSFEIFRETAAGIPVIFTTCYDQFMLQAFENNGIDYLLKPVEKKDVEKALAKYDTLRTFFNRHQPADPFTNLINMVQAKNRSRIIVKKGAENVVLKLEDVVLFYTENKISFTVDKHSHKYLLDRTLTDIEAGLDKNMFFRANRRYIINLNYVRSFKPYEKVKLLIELNMTDRSHPVVISQETAPSFRRWMREA